MFEFIAHIKKDESGNWAEPHLLEDHLNKVSKLTGRFAFGYGSDWAELAGLWHDLGKYQSRFQDYIRAKTGFSEDAENANIEDQAGRVTHSTAGAKHAIEKFGLIGRVLAYLIAGHHAGLPDWSTEMGGRGSLKARLESDETLAEYTESKKYCPPELLVGSVPITRPPCVSENGEGLHLWIRLLFSCLVDADFLDTESYMNPQQGQNRQLATDQSLELLKQKFDEYMLKLSKNSHSGEVNEIRKDVLSACIKKSMDKPGLYSLTVPTGGGKTLSSLGFALHHALHHKKDRIIYVIPFTSIIEQTAEVFRKVLGDDAVVEHHSNLEVDEKQESSRSRLATENWDARVIVTTNVQFFESLYAAKTSRVRKLHNIVNSVVILDEAQTLPREFLKPVFSVINLLAKYYQVTFLFCTATQPYLKSIKDSHGNELYRVCETVNYFRHATSSEASFCV